MYEAFLVHMHSRFPELSRQRFLLALSGGLDSMVLAHLCFRAGLDFDLAHGNFGLRGKESDEDQALVEETAKNIKKKIHIKHFKTDQYVFENKVSIQMAARELRYGWFRDLVAEHHLDWIVTAHHLDDALETFLINLSRGSGLEGLCGIPEKSGRVRRPLLVFRREQLEAYARESGVRWREDRSNTDPKYLRNRVRRDVVPALKEVFPGLLDQFAGTLDHLRGSRALVERYMEGIGNRISSERDGILRFRVAALRRLDPLQPHLYALFSEYGFTDWEAIGNLLEPGSGREVVSPTHRLLRDREYLLLRPLDASPDGSFRISPGEAESELPIRLHFETVKAIGERDPSILYVDKETLNKGLVLRKWRKGDYFYPLGMQGRKKVSKFFKDIRLSRFQKEDSWLLCNGEDIVWIVGYRADDRFKVTDKTRQILKITWEQN